MYQTQPIPNIIDAISRGDEELVQQLLDTGADPNQQSFNGIPALYLSIKSENWTITNLLLKAGADVNTTSGEKDNLTALHLIIQDPKTSSTISKWRAEILFEFGADPNSRDSRGRTALHHAAESGKRDEISYLVERGVDINLAANGGLTALMNACYFMQKDSLEALIDSNADVNAVSATGLSALGYLASGKNSKNRRLFNHDLKGMVERLLQAGADPNLGGGYCAYPIHAAALYSPPGLGYVRSLLDHGADPLAEGGEYFNALQAAVCNKRHSSRENIIKILLERGVPINARSDKNETALTRAVKAKCAKWVIEELLDAGADIHMNYGSSEKKYTILGHAVRLGNAEAVEILLEHGASLDTITGYWEEDLLMYASSHATKDDTRIVSAPLKAGADPNKPGQHRETALQAAASEGYFAVARLLLDYGADVNIVSSTHYGGTALHYSVKGPGVTRMGDNRAEMAALLLKAGANVRAVNSSGALALHLVSLRDCDWSVFKLLLDAGGPTTVNFRNKRGSTPLHEAAECGVVRIVTEVLKYKRVIDINALDSMGRTPLHLAAIRGHEKIVSMLLSNGANCGVKDSDGKAVLMHMDHWSNRQITRSLEDAERRQSGPSFLKMCLFGFFLLFLAFFLEPVETET